VQNQAVQVAIAAQNLALLPVIKSFVREESESERFRDQTRRVLALENRHLRMMQLISPVTRILLTAGLVVLLWSASAKVASGEMAPGDLVSILLYGVLMSLPLSSLANVYGEIQTVRGAAARVLDAFSVQPEPFQDGKPPMPPIRGEIRFEDIWFRYPGRGELFAGIDLKVAAGETVALTGPNGAGKSTLAHLLMRLIEPRRGRITIDGVDISQVDLTSLRQQIGLIDQNTLLFNGTVAENIAYGRSDASAADLERAARAAHAHRFIEELPEGFDTRIGDEGVKLSGGQKQRIALARVLLKDPPILIMDEATSMFDPHGERAFIRECHELLRSRTVILITHRPESLKLADRIIRLDADGAG
jgi:ABC-type multidrug transport system fused ATPase/permease subunit